jgi:hypothetical protein
MKKKSQLKSLGHLSDKILALGIKIQNYSDGEHLALCPWCSHLRKKKTVKCLSIKIDGQTFKYICHHCGEKGNENEATREQGIRPRDTSKVWRRNIQTKWY